MITYQIGDNEYKAFVAELEGTASTTVYIIHDWNGLDDYEIGRARMLAEQGYRAVALDLFGLDCMNYQKHIFTHTKGTRHHNRNAPGHKHSNLTGRL